MGTKDVCCERERRLQADWVDLRGGVHNARLGLLLPQIKVAVTEKQRKVLEKVFSEFSRKMKREIGENHWIRNFTGTKHDS